LETALDEISRSKHTVSVYCNMMRIIAGTKREMRLFSPKGLDSRPITDRVKESLFNVLRKYDLPEGAMAADLFCGVGSLGLETLSRGAEFVTFVESQPEIIAVLKRNIEKAGFVRTSKVIRADVFKTGTPPAAAARISNFESRISNVQKYDLVFVDPPYTFTEDVGMGSPLSKLLDLLQEQTAHNGLVVVRTARRTTLSERYGQFEVIERRQWGTMAVVILKLADK
jgi:16S rRNA (guanine966-N2)-methyltransferase